MRCEGQGWGSEPIEHSRSSTHIIALGASFACPEILRHVAVAPPGLMRPAAPLCLSSSHVRSTKLMKSALAPTLAWSASRVHVLVPMSGRLTSAHLGEG